MDETVKMKKVSIILTTYNSLANVKRTLSSIFKQDYPHLEIVVQDGGSIDGTKEFLIEAAKDKDNFKWSSSRDEGIYDAMNKGYAMATGDLLLFFNDEFAYNHVISDMVQLYERSSCCGVHADLAYVDENGKTIRSWIMGSQQCIQGGGCRRIQRYCWNETYMKNMAYTTQTIQLLQITNL